MKSSRIPQITLGLVLVFFYAPVLFLVVSSFNESRYPTTWGGFSTKWYEGLFENRDLMDAAKRSLIVGFWATLISMFIGTLGACALHWWRSRMQTMHRMLLTLPLVMPDLLMGVSLLMVFISVGMELGMLTIILAHITFCSSYVTFVVLARLQEFDRQLLDAARDLGASRWQAMLRVFLPIIAPGILIGGLLAFTLSIDDFVITFFVSGPGSTTLPLKVYSMVRMGRFLPQVSALSTILLVLTFVAVLASRNLFTTSKQQSN